MIKTRKTPQRTCLGCRQAKDKKDLIRIVKSPDGTVSVDLTGKKSGRGAYLCPDPNCLEKAVRSKALERSLGAAIDEKVFDELRLQLKERTEKEE
jgi:predicted RNA-binding protein YlxR (DUF448 family)